MILVVSKDGGAVVNVSVREVPADMSDRDVWESIQAVADEGNVEALSAVRSGCGRIDMCWPKRSTRVYLDNY